MSKKSYNIKRTDLDAKIANLESWIVQESGAEDETLLIHLKAAQKEYNERRIRLHD